MVTTPQKKVLATGPSGPAIRDFPAEERPRERLRTHGAGNLSNSELMAILLRTGLEGENVVAMSVRLLATVDGLQGLSRVNYEELCELKGISDAKACQLLAGIELGRRVSGLEPNDAPRVGSPADIAKLYMPEMSAYDREHMRVVLLNTKNQVVGADDLYVGSVNAALVRPAEVFAAAVRRNLPAVMVVHNHPSGDPTPSPEDIRLTAQLVEAGRILDVEVIDHVVIGQGRYVSMRERKLGF
ncbi:MAG: DNA repair protein RadC [Chloroflexi bacterium]|nr:DNA repair protein RadC [Chloroflexota bacterium]MDA1296394.1 DNA repair protein RadC [Chloroflexota bacterium]